MQSGLRSNSCDFHNQRRYRLKRQKQHISSKYSAEKLTQFWTVILTSFLRLIHNTHSSVNFFRVWITLIPQIFVLSKNVAWQGPNTSYPFVQKIIVHNFSMIFLKGTNGKNMKISCHVSPMMALKFLFKAITQVNFVTCFSGGLGMKNVAQHLTSHSE